MTVLTYLVPIALFLGGLGLAAFLWALRSGQYEDLDGAAERILLEEPGPDPVREAEARVSAPARRPAAR
jgi:cbb3-type cytochrome oxidase maturation protein